MGYIGQRAMLRRDIERHRSLLGRICSISSRSHSFSTSTPAVSQALRADVGAVGELVGPFAVLADQDDAGAPLADVLDDRLGAAVPAGERT